MEMAQLETAVAAAGALGGKGAGAGAGGSMFFLMKGDTRAAAPAVAKAGARVLPFSWAVEGLKTW